MKKILILAYDFPPYVSVGGLRPYSWYKYLHEFGVYPIIVTRQWSNKLGNHLDYISQSESDKNIIEETAQGTIIKTPYQPNFANKLMLKYGDTKYKFIRKIISGYYEFAQFLFLTGTKSLLYFSAEEFLEKNKVDAIIATGDPFVLFKYASKLSKKFNVPWIADYRDLWSQDLIIHEKTLFKIWLSYFEKKIVKTSYLITSVSYFNQIKISSLIKNKEFLILPNGYDPEAVQSVKDIKQQSEVLSIASIGTLYNWHPTRSFFAVISKFIKDKKNANINISFYGINIVSELSEMLSIEFPDLKNHVDIYPKMPNNLILQELAKKNVMLLFNHYSIMGTKIYDFIGIKRAILYCYTNDEEANKLKAQHYLIKEIPEASNRLQEDLINETNSGYIIQDAKHLLKVLEQLYDEFNEKGYIQCNTINAENYSRKYQVEQLAEVIKQIPSQKNNKNLSQ